MAQLQCQHRRQVQARVVVAARGMASTVAIPLITAKLLHLNVRIVTASGVLIANRHLCQHLLRLPHLRPLLRPAQCHLIVRVEAWMLALISALEMSLQPVSNHARGAVEVLWSRSGTSWIVLTSFCHPFVVSFYSFLQWASLWASDATEQTCNSDIK